MSLLIDSNVFVSAVLGRSAPLLRHVILNCAAIMPMRVHEEASKLTAALLLARQRPPVGLSDLFGPANTVSMDVAFEHEAAAKWLLGRRHASDWPILATAMAFEAPIWTKDRDFLGTGVATWNNRTIRFYVDGTISPLADESADR